MTSINAPLAPEGYFFRVGDVDSEGDVKVSLIRKSFSWWKPDITVEYTWAFRRDLAHDAPIVIKECMNNLLHRWHRRCAISSIAGDYPPKTTIG